MFTSDFAHHITVGEVDAYHVSTEAFDLELVASTTEGPSVVRGEIKCVRVREDENDAESSCLLVNPIIALLEAIKSREGKVSVVPASLVSSESHRDNRRRRRLGDHEDVVTVRDNAVVDPVNNVVEEIFGTYTISFSPADDADEWDLCENLKAASYTNGAGSESDYVLVKVCYSKEDNYVKGEAKVIAQRAEDRVHSFDKVVLFNCDWGDFEGDELWELRVSVDDFNTNKWLLHALLQVTHDEDVNLSLRLEITRDGEKMLIVETTDRDGWNRCLKVTTGIFSEGDEWEVLVCEAAIANESVKGWVLVTSDEGTTTHIDVMATINWWTDLPGDSWYVESIVNDNDDRWYDLAWKGEAIYESKNDDELEFVYKLVSLDRVYSEYHVYHEEQDTFEEISLLEDFVVEGHVKKLSSSELEFISSELEFIHTRQRDENAPKQDWKTSPYCFEASCSAVKEEGTDKWFGELAYKQANTNTVNGEGNLVVGVTGSMSGTVDGHIERISDSDDSLFTKFNVSSDASWELENKNFAFTVGYADTKQDYAYMGTPWWENIEIVWKPLRRNVSLSVWDDVWHGELAYLERNGETGNGEATYEWKNDDELEFVYKLESLDRVYSKYYVHDEQGTFVPISLLEDFVVEGHVKKLSSSELESISSELELIHTRQHDENAPKQDWTTTPYCFEASCSAVKEEGTDKWVGELAYKQANTNTANGEGSLILGDTKSMSGTVNAHIERFSHSDDLLFANYHVSSDASWEWENKDFAFTVGYADTKQHYGYMDDDTTLDDTPWENIEIVWSEPLKINVIMSFRDNVWEGELAYVPPNGKTVNGEGKVDLTTSGHVEGELSTTFAYDVELMREISIDIEGDWNENNIVWVESDLTQQVRNMDEVDWVDMTEVKMVTKLQFNPPTTDNDVSQYGETRLWGDVNVKAICGQHEEDCNDASMLVTMTVSEVEGGLHSEDDSQDAQDDSMHMLMDMTGVLFEALPSPSTPVPFTSLFTMLS